VTTHAVEALWRQADVRHDRDVDPRDGLDRLRHGHTTLELHRGGPAFLDEADAARQGLLGADLVRAER
jgi:hypothetical protein